MQSSAPDSESTEERRRGEQIEALLDALESIPPAKREDYLARACPDPNLRQEALALLAAEGQAGDYLDHLAEELVPDLYDLPDLSGRRIGAWRLLRPLGRGGMGVVYEADRADGAFEQRVALKLLTAALVGSDAHERFLAERRILAGLKHPAIAHIVDGGVTEDGTPWFAMEHVDGEPIDAYCDRHQLDIHKRLELFLQICDAVEHAHRRLVVHRDLKPANVLATEDRRVKLLDFGIARLLDAEEETGAAATRTASRLMTPEYASPEQVRGEPVTTASDVYQLGLVLYELLSGHRPYVLQRRSASEIERVVCEQVPTRLSVAITHEDTVKPTGTRTEHAGSASGSTPDTSVEAVCRARRSTPARLRRRLRGDLENIVATALSKEPERRYGSADRLAQDIRRHLEGLPVTARADTWIYRSRKFLERNAIAAVTAAMLLLAAAGMVAFHTIRIQNERDQAQVERDRAQVESTKAQQISEFLAAMIRSVDPREARGAEVTVRQALDRGMERVDRELDSQPEVQADMLHVLGRTYLELGVYDAAERSLTRTLDLRRVQLGPAHPQVAEVLRDVGRLRMFQGAYDEAVARLEEAQRILEQSPGDHAAILASVLNVLGQVHRARGAYERSLPIFERALEAQLRASGEGTESVASIVRNIGTVLFEMDDYERAERHYEQALEIYEREAGDDHPHVGYVLQDLARVRLEMGKLTDLGATYRRSLAIVRRAYGSVHFEVGVTLHNFGHFLTATGRDEEAVEILEQALEIFGETAEAEHPVFAYPLLELGDAHLAGGRLREARSRYRQSMDHRSKTLGEGGEFDPVFAHGLVRLGRVEDELGNATVAAKLQDRALAIWQKAPDDIGAQLAPALLELGIWLAQERRCTDAAPLLRQARRIELPPRSTLASQVTELERLVSQCGVPSAP